MSVTISATDAKNFLAELGYTIPDTVLTLLITKVDGIDACLEGAGYDDATQTLIKLYAVALMSASSGARKIASQGAPSGASRSFKYDDDAIKWLRDSLSALDKSGCTDSLPITAGNDVGLFLVVGGC